MKRSKNLPPVSFSTGLFDNRQALREVMPFRRSWKLISVVAVMAAIFIIPAVTTFNTVYEEWGRLDNLFDLVSALFLSLWLLGWSMAPLFLGALLILLLFGAEVLSARPGFVRLAIGIPGLMGFVEYDVFQMRNLRRVVPEKKSTNSWRGPHMAFDYAGTTVSFGSAIGNLKASELSSRIDIATGTTIKRGSIENGDLSAPHESVGKADLVNKLSSLLKAKAAYRTEKSTVERVNISADEVEAGTVFTFSTLVLVLANLVPVVGALYFGWDLASVLVIYWAESAVIGFYNLCKIMVIGGVSSFLYGILFISHFGAFMVIHFLFLYHIFIAGLESSMSVSLSEVALFLINLWPAVTALFISHGISFVQNFLGHKEYLNRTAKKQMNEPYQRIIFMHMVIIIGAGLMSILGDSAIVLMLVIAAKILADIRAHARERQKVTKN